MKRIIVLFAICLVLTMVFVACNDPKVPDETTDANSTEVITTDTEAPTTAVEITEVETEAPTTEEVTETQAVTTEKVTTEKVTTEEVTTEEVTTEAATTEEVTTEAVTTPPAPPAGGGGGGGVYMHRIRFDLGGEHAFLYVEIYNTSSVASLEVFDVLSTLSNSIFPKMAIFYDTLSHETASAVILSAIPGTQTITYSISGKQTVDTAQFDSNAQVDDQVKPISDLN